MIFVFACRIRVIGTKLIVNVLTGTPLFGNLVYVETKWLVMDKLRSDVI